MNLGSIAKQVLGTVAPTILTAIGGPFGALAGGILHAALGTGGDEKAVDTALSAASPDTLLKVKQAEADLQAKLTELGIQREQLVYSDIANARAREIAVKDMTPRNLAYLIIGFTGLAIAATLAGWTKVDSALAGTLIGYLVAECRSTLTYYFGSSQSSQAKDATLAEIAKS